MNTEEYLDSKIAQAEQGEILLPNDNQEVAAYLLAAERLTMLRGINVPPEFAQRLETRVRASARTHEVFHRNEKTTLLALPGSSAGTLRSSSRPEAPQRRRIGFSALGIAAVLIVMFVGVLTTSANSLPGDLLYGVKQVENRLSLSFADDPKDHSEITINQLQNSLADLKAVVNQGRGDTTISMALNVVASNTKSSQESVAALPAGSERDMAQHDLASALAEEQQTLRLLLNRLDWPMQLAFTHQLGALGEPVPTITSAQVHFQYNGTLLITLGGANFSPQAAFIFDGRPGGIVSQVTPTQIVAVINRSVWSSGTHDLGIRNPDGTAAQALYHSSDDGQRDDNQRSGGTHNTNPGGGGNDE